MSADYCPAIMSFHSHSECEHIVDIVKRCFQMNCTDELTIGHIIDKVKEKMSQWEAEAQSNHCASSSDICRKVMSWRNE
ncbi:hypothetical protein D918_03111 [Trichuris suis]|nr:hypothetical protein D918_03111 [Trichuris suis]